MTRRGEQVRAQAVVSSSQGETVYDRHSARLYQQALLTLGDAALAERVVGEVITRTRMISRVGRRRASPGAGSPGGH